MGEFPIIEVVTMVTEEPAVIFFSPCVYANNLPKDHKEIGLMHIVT
jgi:hypothetical protein